MRRLSNPGGRCWRNVHLSASCLPQRARHDSRKRRHRLVVALSAALAFAFVLPGSTLAGKSTRHMVQIQGAKFEPDTIEVNRGETIVWVNHDPYPHTVTASGGFDSRSIPAGGQWQYAAHTAGDFPFVCTLHPDIKLAPAPRAGRSRGGVALQI
ncbi:cupredoxin domain-containing protein [Cupriavidus sp. TMH.W2]|uniref:cupredoxin domain-containing protein n=1 Tax=Cupriavidus sp. TMH.W2 TaxID=3434465 RepID=UPI003D77FDAE